MPELPTKESVFGRRATPTSSRGIYGYQAGQEAAADVRRGQAIQEIGADIGVEAEKRQKELDDLDLVRAQAYALREYTKLEQAMLDDPQSKWEDYEPKYRQAQAAAGGMVRNKALAEKFTLGLDQMNLGAWDKFKTRDRARKNDEYVADYIKTKDDLDSEYFDAIRLGDFDRAMAVNNLRSRVLQTFHVAQPDLISKERIAIDEMGASKVVRDALSTRPPDEIISILSADQPSSTKQLDAGFEANIPLLQKVEGGYVAVDGASGEPAVYGINRKWHPEAFDEANRLRLESGDAAGKAYAAEFYKKEYWDKYGLDKYSPDQQAVLFDAMVNHSAQFRNELLAAADKGATAAELIGKRYSEYARLAESDAYAPSYRGWVKRLDDVEKHIGLQRPKREGVYGQLSPADEVALLEDARVRLERDIPKRVAETMRYAPINASIPEGMNTEAGARANAQRIEAFQADPVPYLQEHPMVANARQRMEENPDTDTIAAYNKSLVDAQLDMGLRRDQVRILPNNTVKDISTAIKSAASGDDLIKIAEGYGTQYPDAASNAMMLREIRSSDLPPAFIELMNPRTKQVARAELADAITFGEAGIKGALPDKAYDNVGIKLKDELVDFMEASIATDPSLGQRVSQQKMQAMQLYAGQLMMRGMNENDAIAAAKKNLLPYKIVDKLIIPEELNSDNVKFTVDQFKDSIGGIKTIVPDEIEGDEIKSDVYRMMEREGTEAVVIGDRIVFVTSNGNAILDADLVERDASGNITNADEAAISIPLTEASLFPQGVMPDDQRSALVKARAAASTLGSSENVQAYDVKDQYFSSGPVARFMSMFDDSGPKQAQIKYRPPEYFNKGFIGKPTPSERGEFGVEAERAMRNAEYFQYVLKNTPKDKRAALLDLAEKSNQAVAAYEQKKADFKKASPSLSEPARREMLAGVRKAQIEASMGIGFNYYNGVPAHIKKWLPKK